MFQQRAWSMLSFAALVLNSVPAGAAGKAASVGATRLTPVAIHADNTCKRMFFESTKTYANTVFMMPEAALSARPDTDYIYDLHPTPDPDVFVLDLNVFFPESTDQKFSKGLSSRRSDKDDCDLDLLKWDMNKNRRKAELVKVIAPAFITSVQVFLQGIKEPSDPIGKIVDKSGGVTKESEVQILDYRGQTKVARFTISAAEKDYFLSKVVDSAGGIQATIRMNFDARGLDGALYAEFNVERFKTDFEAALRAQPQLTKVSVKTLLSSSLDKSYIDITNEAGSDSANAMVATLMTKIIAEFSLAVDKMETPASTVGGGDPGNTPVTIEAAIKAVSSISNRRLNYTQMAQSDVAIAETSQTLSVTKLRDYNVNTLQVKSGWVEPSVGLDLKEGQTMGISVIQGWVEDIIYDQESSYMTTADIKKFRLVNKMSAFANRRMDFENEEINGVLMAIGRRGMFNDISRWFYGSSKEDENDGAVRSRGYNFCMWNHPCEFRVRHHRTVGYRNRKSSFRVQNPTMNDAKVMNDPSKWMNDVTSWPVALSFSVAGDNIITKLSDLFEENDLWKATFDQQLGRVLITAKKDLGQVRIPNLMRDGQYLTIGAPIATDSVELVKIFKSGEEKSMGVMPLNYDRGPIKTQTTLVLNVYRPTPFLTQRARKLQPSDDVPVAGGGAAAGASAGTKSLTDPGTGRSNRGDNKLPTRASAPAPAPSPAPLLESPNTVPVPPKPAQP